jgi:peroxiredoxin family protein
MKYFNFLKVFLCFYGLNQLRMHSTFVSKIPVVVVEMFEVLDYLLFLDDLFDYV